MELLRTPEDQFDDLPNFSYQPEYVTLGEPRMAYIDEGEGPETFLCLHGEPSWSFLYRKMIPTLTRQGRVIAPDFIGFGRSDKFIDEEAYNYQRYYDWLEDFIHKLGLRNITLICQDWGGLLGLPVAMNNQDRFKRIVPMNTGLVDGSQEMPQEWWEFRNFVQNSDELPIGFLIQEACIGELSEDIIAGYRAPFPDSKYKAAARKLPFMVPTNTEMNGAKIMKKALERLATWQKPAYVLFSDSDPITQAARDPLRELIPTAPEQHDIWIQEAGHFLQEDSGKQVAQEIVSFVNRTS